MGKLDQYAAWCYDWSNSEYKSRWPTDFSIRLVVKNHYPPQMFQWAANEIMLRVVEREFNL